MTCALMAYSGVRPEVVGNYLGDTVSLSEISPKLDPRAASPVPEGPGAGGRPRVALQGPAHLPHFRPASHMQGNEDYLDFRIAQGEKVARASDLVRVRDARRRPSCGR